MDTIGPDAVRRALLELEPLTHRLPPGAGRAAVEALLAPEFWEVGASGSVYRRDYVIDVVADRYAAGIDPDDATWTVTEFAVRRLSDAAWLATYLLRQDDRLSRRATLWERTPSGWRASYHQGTLAGRAAQPSVVANASSAS